jgi:hypothetical protein
LSRAAERPEVEMRAPKAPKTKPAADLPKTALTVRSGEAAAKKLEAAPKARALASGQRPP